jgi:hypothetical protein
VAQQPAGRQQLSYYPGSKLATELAVGSMQVAVRRPNVVGLNEGCKWHGMQATCLVAPGGAACERCGQLLQMMSSASCAAAAMVCHLQQGRLEALRACVQPRSG